MGCRGNRSNLLFLWVCVAAILPLGCTQSGAPLSRSSTTRPSVERDAAAPDLASIPPGRFAEDIKRFVEEDRANPPKPGGTLFVGSSTFQRWTDIPKVFAEFDATNRAFGGSVSPDQLMYMDWIVLPRKPGKILYYCGDNDLNAGATPEKVAADYQSFVQRVHARLPETKIYFVSIKFSPSRIRLIDNMRKANELVVKFTQTDPSRLRFIDINPAICDAAGQPNASLYVADMLHLNPRGYELITPVLHDALARDRISQ